MSLFHVFLSLTKLVLVLEPVLSCTARRKVTDPYQVVLTPEEERDFWASVGYSMEASPGR